MPISKPGHIRPFQRLSHIAAAFTLTLCLAAAGHVHAQAAPDTENGRYTLSPVAGDFLRLDTRTGVVSTCSNKGDWVCRVVPDERAALDSEIGKLRSENQTLKDQLAQRNSTVPGKTDAPLAKEDKKSVDASPGSKIELQLPDHQKLMALIDRIWDQLVEMATRVQKKLSEKI